MEGSFGEGSGVEGYFDRGRGGGRDDFGADGRVLDVVEGETGAVDGAGVPGVEDRAQVAGGDAWLEDQGLVRFWYTVSVVEDGECPVAAVYQ